MTASAARPKPTLDLGALEPERAFVRIDGKDYRYRADMDLNLVDLAQIERIRERIDELYRNAAESPSDVTDPERARLVGRMIREGVELIMFDPIPRDVMAKLNDVQALAILDSFTRATSRAASRKSSKARPAETAAPSRSTSRRSSRASKGSTRAAARRRG